MSFEKVPTGEVSRFGASDHPEAPRDSGAPKREVGSNVELLRRTVARLRFDTNSGIIPEQNFDPTTGEDLRDNEFRRLVSISTSMLTEAERDMQAALHIPEDAVYGKITGVPIPPKQFDGKGNTTLVSLSARLGVFRREVYQQVAEAQARGVVLPRYDAQTGEEIPPDSLRAYRNVMGPQVQGDDTKQLERELDLALNALGKMKSVRREDEFERVKRGLQPRG